MFSSIFKKDIDLNDLNKFAQNSMMDHLGIEFIEVGADYLVARMPVDHRTVQPFGMLNGGASAALAENVGSMAANLCVDPTKNLCVGLDINANHLKGVGQGFVYGKAKPLHLGKNTQVWEIKIRDEDQNLVCVSRLTMAVIERRK